MLDVERGPRRNMDAFTSNLDHERLAQFHAVREPPQLRYELGARIGLFNIALRFATCIYHLYDPECIDRAHLVSATRARCEINPTACNCVVRYLSLYLRPV